MEALIKDRFNEAVLLAAMQRYGIAPGKIRALDAFENFIYELEFRQKIEMSTGFW